MDRAALRAQISHAHHEIVRISSHLEHASSKIDLKNYERAKYFLDCSRKELDIVIHHINDLDKQFFRKEASYDAVPKQTS